jgi:hypothetical protein
MDLAVELNPYKPDGKGLGRLHRLTEAGPRAGWASRTGTFVHLSVVSCRNGRRSASTMNQSARARDYQ